MKIGIAQMNSKDDKSENVASAERLIDLLAAEGAKLIMLPEYFLFLGAFEDLPGIAESIDGPSMERIREKAVSNRVYIHSGSFPEKEGREVYNTSLVFDPNGNLIAKYRKIFLFDVELPDGKVIKESSTITPGFEVATFKVDEATFGMSICYDLRFPELYRKLTKLGAQVILVPAAFTLQTGRDHWELLLRARAVENLCWVLAGAQWGTAPPNHVCYGRSMVINPWGLVVSQAPDGVSYITADIDLNALESVRTIFPALDHKREDIFPL